jgi:hypothetical protein
MRAFFPLRRASGIGRRCLLLLYPELRGIQPGRWANALERARQAELTLVERAGFVAAVGFAAWLLRPLADPGAVLVLRYIEQFMLALPVIALLVSPLLVRRTRRGLRREAGSSHGDEPCPEPQAATRTAPGPVEPQRTVAHRRAS